nr:hypothetical protein [uncultured Brevundimonas sp.]
MSYQTKSWERDRPPVFAQKVAYIDDLAVTITPPRHVVGSRVETQDDFDEMSEWLTANCRWTFRIIGRPLPPSPDWGGSSLFWQDLMRAAIIGHFRQSLVSETLEPLTHVVSVEFRRKEDATLFKMFWGAEG